MNALFNPTSCAHKHYSSATFTSTKSLTSSLSLRKEREQQHFASWNHQNFHKCRRQLKSLSPPNFTTAMSSNPPIPYIDLFGGNLATVAFVGVAALALSAASLVAIGFGLKPFLSMAFV